ncbi:MAG: DUF4432 family protein [Pedosphaera sp.]|nr:DUF4432 family protein [Pedosphaera sp.]
MQSFPRVTSFVVALIATWTANAAAPTFQKTLISTTQNIHTAEWRMNASDLPSSPAGAQWQITKTTLHGGKQEGVDLITLDNGRLKIRLIPTRGMGVLDATLGEVRLGWDSPIKEIVHPRHMNLESRGGLGWIEGFNEWMARCGLEFAGHPGRDKFITNTGATGEMDLTLHGKIANIPAAEVVVEIDREPPHRLRVRGRVDERVFFGPKLELWAEISTVPGSNEFTLHDRLINRGAAEQEFMLIYHANFGAPLLGAGARVVVPIARVVPFNAHAAKAAARWAAYEAPVTGFVEEVFMLHPIADATGRTTALLHNARSDRGMTMSWLVKELPYLTQWKNTAALADGYVTGLEPGTSFPHNRSWERERGRVAKLKPGETREFKLQFAIQSNAAEVKAAAEKIRALQGDKPPVVETEPEK